VDRTKVPSNPSAKSTGTRIVSKVCARMAVSTHDDAA
jgi:hypothetical protein